MANPVLDFVMSLVRDPEAAAHYAADPAQAIADAHLTDVTSADVNQLMAVVADSPSAAVPTTGADPFSAITDHNVWTSDAATAAFDAFGDHLPEQVIDDPHGVITDLVGSIDQPVVDTALPHDVPSLAGFDDLHVDAPAIIEDVPAGMSDGIDPAWVQSVQDDLQDHHSLPDDPGFDQLV